MPTTRMGEEDIALPEVDGSPCSSSDEDVDGLLRVNAQIDDVKATPQKKKDKDKEVKHQSCAIHEISKLNRALRKLLASTPAPGVLV